MSLSGSFHPAQKKRKEKKKTLSYVFPFDSISIQLFFLLLFPLGLDFSCYFFSSDVSACFYSGGFEPSV